MRNRIGVKLKAAKAAKAVKALAIIPLLVLLTAGPVKGSGVGAAFLKIGVGARPMGMGGAYTAVADDINSVQWNPAGLSRMERSELGAMDADMFADTKVALLGYGRKLKDGSVLAVSGVYLWQDAIEGRGSNREPEDSFNASDMAAGVSYGWKAGDKATLGLTGKFIRSKIADASATGWAIDGGAQYDLPLEGVRAGAVISNFGSGLKFLDERSDLPLSGALGIAWHSKFKLTLAGDVRRQLKENRNMFSLGAEYEALPMLALRMGYISEFGDISRDSTSLEDRGGISAGIGIILKSFRLDYAFTPMGELGKANRLSVAFQF